MFIALIAHYRVGHQPSVFAKSAPYFYVSGLDSISVFDVSDPLSPKLTGTLPNLLFDRRNATRFTPNSAPNVKNGNVLLVTEEDYENTTAGSSPKASTRPGCVGSTSAIRATSRNTADLVRGLADRPNR